MSTNLDPLALADRQLAQIEVRVRRCIEHLSHEQDSKDNALRSLEALMQTLARLKEHRSIINNQRMKERRGIIHSRIDSEYD
jgi:hypothetical protein